MTAYIVGIDFTMVQQQDQAQQVFSAGSQSEAEYLKMLQKVSSEVKSVALTKPSQEKMIFENTDGLEIFEVDDGNKPVGTPNVFDEPMVPQPGDKVRPNDPCPCGSGKKYKKCC